jgi:hypothetical protein
LRFLSSWYSATPTTATRVAVQIVGELPSAQASTGCFRKSDMPCPHNATCAQHPCKTFSRIQGLSVNALISSPPKRVVAALSWTRSLELERQSHAGAFQFPSALEPLLNEEMDWTINDKFGPPASPFLSSGPIMAPEKTARIPCSQIATKVVHTCRSPQNKASQEQPGSFQGSNQRTDLRQPSPP